LSIQFRKFKVLGNFEVLDIWKIFNNLKVYDTSITSVGITASISEVTITYDPLIKEEPEQQIVLSDNVNSLQNVPQSEGSVEAVQQSYWCEVCERSFSWEDLLLRH
jgi:hypothetical protein